MDRLTDRQTDKRTYLQISSKFWQVTNTTNKHICQNQILESNERAIGDCILAKISLLRCQTESSMPLQHGHYDALHLQFLFRVDTPDTD